jgi:hypothetical protein
MFIHSGIVFDIHQPPPQHDGMDGAYPDLAAPPPRLSAFSKGRYVVRTVLANEP